MKKEQIYLITIIAIAAVLVTGFLAFEYGQQSKESEYEEVMSSEVEESQPVMGPWVPRAIAQRPEDVRTSFVGRILEVNEEEQTFKIIADIGTLTGEKADQTVQTFIIDADTLMYFNADYEKPNGTIEDFNINNLVEVYASQPAYEVVREEATTASMVSIITEE